jgi:membrane-bound metal-dependent hydrolase YbcI (DUF457 family)
MIFFGHLGFTLLFVFVVFYFLKENVDYRLALLGAILPDLLDKPIGDYLFYSLFQNGRIFGHTLLFVFVLAAAGYYVNRKYAMGSAELLALGALLHITEDQMWAAPQTLLWPLLGWEFPKYDLENYAGYILYQLLHEPSAYVPEVIGVAILAAFVAYFKLYHYDRLKAFIADGELTGYSRGKVAVAG